MDTIWKPDLRERTSPRYLAIADALATDIESGVLRPGTRLPTHRDLAEALGLTVGTVSRAYGEAERRGLTVGEVGRGTFVRTDERDASGWGTDSESPGTVDLSLNHPVYLGDEEGDLLRRTLQDIAASPDMDELLRYFAHSAPMWHRATGAEWLERAGIEGTTPEQVVVTAGAQHGLTVALSTLTRPGDVVLTEELTYPGMKSLAQMLGLRLRGVELDDEGIIPDGLRRACETDHPVALYVVPNIQNPTAVTMSARRREEIAEIAKEHQILIIEDDIHAFLDPGEHAPIFNLAPERTLYVASTAKGLNPALRTGFVYAPARAIPRLMAGVRSTMWMPAPLMTEVVVRWIREGVVDGLLARKRQEIVRRQSMAKELLGGFEYTSRPHAYHIWLTLPQPWRSEDFVRQARQRGVLISGAEAFAVGRQSTPHAVRVCLGQPQNPEDLRRALGIIADILDDCCEPCVSIL